MEILNLAEHIRILEELLLHQDFSANPEALEAMLGEDFREVNPDGREVSRKDVLAWLLAKDPEARWEFSEFTSRQLADDLVLATYTARQVFPANASSGGARHCSLWRQSGEGQTWQLVFHQSTRLA